MSPYLMLLDMVHACICPMTPTHNGPFAAPNVMLLEHHALRLFHLPQIVVPNQEQGNETQSHDTSASAKHPRLAVSVSLLNSNARRATLLVAQLSLKIPINHVDILHGIRR